ncbi:arylamine N-acetyltransferase [Corynebacterium bovis]|uniref:arylamine N-acetyltransferase family protein n=1 Tax=Corynebacterium bovis TaxID=36808 RepID=UPI00366EECDD
MSTLIDRYLARTGHPVPAGDRSGRTAGQIVADLDRLLAAHADTIPFEDLDSASATPFSVDEDAVVAKLVDARRGGYCHEHAALIRAVLRDMGLTVRPVLARVYARDGLTEVQAFGHQATIVTLPSDATTAPTTDPATPAAPRDPAEVLVDPGFGGGTPTVAVPLDGTVRDSPQGPFRVVPAADAIDPALVRGLDLMLQHRAFGAAEFANVYAFSRTAVWEPVDLDMSHWLTSARPGTFFTGNIVIARHRPDGGRVTVFQDTVHRVAPGVPGPDGSPGTAGEERRERVGSPEELAGVLREEFGLGVDAALVRAAWEHSGAGRPLPRPRYPAATAAPPRAAQRGSTPGRGGRRTDPAARYPAPRYPSSALNTSELLGCV